MGVTAGQKGCGFSRTLYIYTSSRPRFRSRLIVFTKLFPFFLLFLLLCLAGDSLGQSINPTDSIAIASAYQGSLSVSPPAILASRTACPPLYRTWTSLPSITVFIRPLLFLRELISSRIFCCSPPGGLGVAWMQASWSGREFFRILILAGHHFVALEQRNKCYQFSVSLRCSWEVEDPQLGYNSK